MLRLSANRKATASLLPHYDIQAVGNKLKNGLKEKNIASN